MFLVVNCFMKKTIIYLLCLIFTLLILWVFIPASEGLVVRMRTIKNGVVSRNIFYIQKDRLKIVAENKSMMFFKGQLCILDNKNKTYWRGDVKEFNKQLVLNGLIERSPYFSRSELFYESLSKKDKFFLKNILSENTESLIDKEAKCELIKTPDFNSIAGYASRKFEIREAGKLVEEIWISDYLKSYLDRELNLELYHDFMRSYLHHSEYEFYNHLQLFMELVKNGFPMKITMYQDNCVTETTVEYLIKKKIKDSVFIIPEGFSKSKLKEVLD